MYDEYEPLDDLVWDRAEEQEQDARDHLQLKTTCRKVEELATEQLKAAATLILPLIAGGFNFVYRVRVDTTPHDIVIRVPCPGAVQLPVDKTMHEAATASLIAKSTALPMPRLLHYGKDPCVGPYLIMQHIEHHTTMLDRMNTPGKDDSEPAVLDPDISEQTLASLWHQVARHNLQLLQVKLPRIGSLVEIAEGVYEVADRPITYNFNTLLQLANIPLSVLPSKGKTYTTADDFYTACAEMHLAQLIFQHNDVITSADDCRNKYVARQIFRRLAKEGKLSVFGFAQDQWSAQSTLYAEKGDLQQHASLAPAPSNTSSFRLWGDDFRPGNILINTSDEIVGIIDWEFTYSAPTQFNLDPPWWLLLHVVDDWPAGMDDWAATYEMRLKTWLSAMEKAETELKSTETMDLPAPLSRYMRESWETGRFWLTYATRISRTFDALYWKYLDERFFGPRVGDLSKENLWKARVDLLTEQEREAMEELGQKKVEDMQERKIVDWDPADAKQHFAKFLLD